MNPRIIWDSIRIKGGYKPWDKEVWFQYRVQRYCYTSWLLCHAQLNIMDRLALFNIPCQLHCSLCVGGLENSHHLFISCPYTQFIMSSILRKNMNITLDFSWNWLDFLLQLLAVQYKRKRTVALLADQVMIYHIWKERNKRIHNGKITCPTELLQHIMVDTRARISIAPWFSQFFAHRLEARTWLSM